MNKAFKYIFIVSICLVPSGVYSYDNVVADCERTTVQNAVTASTNGDTITVPAGSCTWVDPVNMTNGKNLTVRGAGVGNTIITATTWGAFNMQFTNSNRITGFEFNCDNGCTSGAVKTYIGGGWRVDSNKFTSDNVFRPSVYALGDNTHTVHNGLIDNNIMVNGRVVMYGSASADISGYQIWAEPLNLGSSDAIYVENNTYTSDNIATNAIDGNSGGRYVFRYNTITDTYIEAHSVQGDGRAIRSWEIYNNSINQVSKTLFSPIMLRGGTGVVFNNTASGTYNYKDIILNNVRSCETRGNYALKCDGTSNWDGNEVGLFGYPCRDQIGRSTDDSAFDNVLDPPSQSLDPAYFWGNGDIGVFIHSPDGGCTDGINYTDVHIVANRDYYDSTQRPGYASYTCPHPLTGLSGSCNPIVAGTAGYNVDAATLPRTSTGTISGSWQ